MRFASCFTGIGAPEKAWESLGWESVWYAEIDKFPCEVLRQRYPNTPNLGDVTAHDFVAKAKALGPIDVLVGGPPCQDFSIAGKRESLEGHRGQLSLRWVEIINAIEPGISITENVPGWLSLGDNAFGCFLAALVGADAPLVPPTGLKWTNAGMVAGPKRTAAWIVKDAQHFGVAQRRERVFVVASAGEMSYPSEVLFEFASVYGNHQASGEEREVVAAIPARSTGGGGFGTDFECRGGLIATEESTHDLSPSMGASGRGFERAGETRGQDPVIAVTRVAAPLSAATPSRRNGGSNPTEGTMIVDKWPSDIAPTLNAHYGDKYGLDNQHMGGGRFVRPSRRSGRREPEDRRETSARISLRRRRLRWLREGVSLTKMAINTSVHVVHMSSRKKYTTRCARRVVRVILKTS